MAGGNGLPLNEHTAFLLVTALMHHDLDDQQDTIRGALEIDPLLAVWTVCMADRRSSVQLKSMHSASRWLAKHFLMTLDSPLSLLENASFGTPARAAWRKMTVNAISVARRAYQLASKTQAASTGEAFWFGMLFSTKQQLDAFAERNGHSPLHRFSLSWPPWALAMQKSIRGSTLGQPTDFCVWRAIEESAKKSLSSELVRGEEQDLWFRPYPEFQMLAPLLIGKLRRLNVLEEEFENTLQNEKLAALQQLAYGASHEINNPLANISTRAQTLLYNEMDTDRRRKLVAINKQAFRAYEMMADLMLFAKPPKLELLEVTLVSLLHKIQDELAPLATERNVRLHVRVGDQPIFLCADSTQIGVAIKAICTNGIEAMHDGGILTIEAWLNPSDKSVSVSIEDQGTGLSDIARRHLFDPFYSGREAGRGLGFGLCKAWGIVQQHHGRIEVSSQRSQGSRFVVTLPTNGPEPSRSQARLPLARTHE